MANTFRKVYKKIANNGNTNDYQLVAEVGVNGVSLDRMTGATSSTNGTQGLVPAPTSGSQNKYLRGDGTWQTPPDNNTTYADATTASHGLMTATMVTKLNGIANNANNYTYTLPAASSTARGGITLNGGTGVYLRGDGNWTTPTNTTYATTSSISSGSTALITSGGVYTKLGLSSSENFVIGESSYASISSAIDGLVSLINTSSNNSSVYLATSESSSNGSVSHVFKNVHLEPSAFILIAFSKKIDANQYYIIGWYNPSAICSLVGRTSDIPSTDLITDSLMTVNSYSTQNYSTLYDSTTEKYTITRNGYSPAKTFKGYYLLFYI